jgi:hypothetical protein
MTKRTAAADARPDGVCVDIEDGQVGERGLIDASSPSAARPRARTPALLGGDHRQAAPSHRKHDTRSA